MSDDKGRSRRDWLRSGAGLFGALVDAVKPAEGARRPSKTPPSREPVIATGREQEILALLGPLADEEFAGGYRFSEAEVGTDRITYRFAGPGGEVRIILAALSRVDAGVVHAYTRSFRLIAEGGSDEARFAVAERVSVEVMDRDEGQLWTVAAEAPRKEDR